MARRPPVVDIVAVVDDDVDALWRPGADVPLATVVESNRAAQPDPVAAADIVPEAQPPPRRRRSVIVAASGFLAVVAVAVGAVVVVDSTDAPAGAIAAADVVLTDAAPVEPFPGADPRRLPSEVSSIWSSVIAGAQTSAEASMIVDGRDRVIGVFDAEPPATGSLFVALDATSGDELWRVPSASEASAFALLGVVQGVVVAERLDLENRSVVGIDVTTGERLWERRTLDPGIHTVLEGTQIVVRVSFTVNARLTFIDPVTGEEIGRVPGRLFATDYLGRWYVRSGDRVSSIDLATGWSIPVEIATLGVTDNIAATVVDGRVLVPDGAAFAENAEDGSTRSLDVVASSSVELPDAVRRFSPMVDDTFVFAGSDAVFGARLRGDTVDVDWQAPGVVVGATPTDRGLLLVVGADADPSRRVIDGATGRTVDTVDVDDTDELLVVGNGIVTRRPADFGSTRVALDLNGVEMWSLLGDGPIAVGDEIVVSFGTGDGGVSVVAFGDTGGRSGG